jgi:hypothetical protein
LQVQLPKRNITDGEIVEVADSLWSSRFTTRLEVKRFEEGFSSSLPPSLAELHGLKAKFIYSFSQKLEEGHGGD